MNNQPYHIDTLKAYLAGELDGKSMHEIEKRALEDPFLAEALESLGQDAKASVGALTDVQQRLRLRVQKTASLRQEEALKKGASRKNWWLAIAAVLVLGLGSLYIFKMQSATDSKRTITREVVQGAISPAPSAMAKNQDTIKSKSPADDHEKVVRTQANTDRSDPLTSENLKQDATSSKETASGKKVQTNEDQSIARIAPLRRRLSKKVSAESTSALTEMAPVENELARAAPNAPIASSEAAQLHQSRQIGSEVQAAGNAAEVTAMGYDRESKRKMVGASPTTEQAALQNIHPIGGMSAYDSYILAQVESFKAKSVNVASDTATVILEFQIPESGQGKPEKIKIIKGAGRKLNKKAIEFLREGVDWQSDPGMQPPFAGSYKVRFN